MGIFRPGGNYDSWYAYGVARINDDPPPPPSFGPSPPPTEFMDIIDKLRGAEMVTVTDANGKKRRELKRLPRTQQEDAFFSKIEGIISKTVINIEELSALSPQAVAGFEPVIKTFTDIVQERRNDLADIASFSGIDKQIQNFVTNMEQFNEENFARDRMGLEEDLAHKGWGNSTSGMEARALAIRNQNMVRNDSRVKADVYAEQLATQKLARDEKAFGLREAERGGRLKGALTGYELERQRLADEEANRQAALTGNTNLLKIGAGIKQQDFDNAAGTRAPDIASQTFQLQSGDSLGRYNAEVGAKSKEYEMAMMDYANRPPSFLDFALQAGGAIGGAMLTGSPGSMGGKLGNKALGMFM